MFCTQVSTFVSTLRRGPDPETEIIAEMVDLCNGIHGTSEREHVMGSRLNTSTILPLPFLSILMREEAGIQYYDDSFI